MKAAASLQRIHAVIRRHGFETRRNLDRLTDMIFWPLLDVLTWGVFTLYLARQGFPAGAQPAHLLAGIILWGGFRAFQRDIAVGFLAEIWSRNIVGLFASPLGFHEYLAALLVMDVCRLAVTLTLAAALARLIGGALPSDVLQLLPALLLLLLFGAAVGIVTICLILRFTSRVQTLAYGIAGLLMPLSCVFYPRAALPAPLRAVAWLLPTTHGFEDMRAVLDGQGNSAAQLLWGYGLALAACAAAFLCFGRVVRSARRRGYLVRLD